MARQEVVYVRAYRVHPKGMGGDTGLRDTADDYDTIEEAVDAVRTALIMGAYSVDVYRFDQERDRVRL